MNEISTQALALLLALATGMLLGAIFFGGLWWTVHTGMTARRPALWFICSMILRIGIVTMGFYFLLSLSGNSWEILLGSLFGFILARLIATRLLPAPLSKIAPVGEPSVGPQGARGTQREERAERAGHAP